MGFEPTTHLQRATHKSEDSDQPLFFDKGKSELPQGLTM